MAEVSKQNSGVNEEQPLVAAKATKTTTAATASESVTIHNIPDFEEVEPLLAKNTCTACHYAEKRQVGPAFVEVAKRKYTNEEIVELIYNPKPQNWSEYATEMPPMPLILKEEAIKLASGINSLDD